MITFIIGLIVLFVGGALYGKFCEKVFGPDDRKTPAIAMEDGVDYVPMKNWKNSLINLLNIAGTGPILGPIQGILFGPIAFILIPIGCVLGGAMHDYMSGMMSIRNNGAQMPEMVRKYTSKRIFSIYNVFVCLLLLLVGVVFIYTPGDIAAKQVFGLTGAANDKWTWIIYGAIFAYYLIATVFPIDKIIGKIYPIFGAILLFSAVGVFIGLFAKGYTLQNLTTANWMGVHPGGLKLIPIFFVTVACGIVSGFHSTQNTLIARSVAKEKEGRMTFYNMMILEGFIAMIWAAAAMGLYAAGTNAGATDMVGLVAKDMLGKYGGLVALIGVIVLPVTSGDTALRGLRLIIADTFKIDQKSSGKRLGLSAVIFAVAGALLIWAKTNADGFNLLWRYFAWSNQTIAIFAFAIITVYLMEHKDGMYYIMSLIPGTFYAFITFTFISNADIGFRLPMTTAYIMGAVFALGYTILVIKGGQMRKARLSNSTVA